MTEIPDTPPRPTKYFLFRPDGYGDGHLLANLLMGEVEVGRIYGADDPYTVSVLKSHQDWESATKQAYDAQVKADKQGEVDETQ